MLQMCTFLCLRTAAGLYDVSHKDMYHRNQIQPMPQGIVETLK